MTNEKLNEITSQLNQTTSDDIVGVSYGFKMVNGSVTSEKSLIYTVKEKKPLNDIPEEDRIPSTIDVDGESVKTDVIQGSVELQGFGNFCDPQWTQWQTVAPGNRNTHRPLMGGVSTTNWGSLSGFVGTLGFIAVDSADNTLVGVSNNHVLVDDAFFTIERDPANIRTNVFQDICTQPNDGANMGPSFKVGVVKKYQPINLQNKVDGALMAIDDISLIDPAVSWMQFGITGMTSAPRFATTAEINTALENPSQEYYMSSRTTGPKGQDDTKLLNWSASSSILISYNKQNVGTNVYMNETFELVASGSSTPSGEYCYYPSAGGDSGSAILTRINDDLVIVGILYGGRSIYDPETETNIPAYSLCNRIDNVADQLGIRAWDGTFNNINGVNNTGGPLTHIVGGVSNQKKIKVGNITYWQLGMVNNSEYPPDPTPLPSPTPTGEPGPTPLPSPTPTDGPIP